MRNDSWRREVLPFLVLGAALIAAYASFFGRYAFDDSYVGYSVTRSLLSGQGFAFDPGAHVLSTSSPLAPLLYAPFAALLHGDVVLAAQIFSAGALAVVAFGSYLLARTFCTRTGALLGALTFTGTPFVLLLWSHETLLCAAACIAGLLLYARGIRTAAAIVLGCAALLRGEALLLLPFVWTGMRKRDIALTLAPFGLWCAFAIPYFGSPFSSTIASKHAQLRYAAITPYLDGLRDYVTRMYALSPSFLWRNLIVACSAVCIAAAFAAGLATRVYLRVIAWAAAITLLYVVLQLPFYFWFCAQLGAAMAASVALLWPRDVRPRMPLVLTAGRAAAIALAAINAGFLVLQDIQPERKAISYDWIVMPAIQSNAYRTLGEHFAQRDGTNVSIAYPEIGQLRYYSGATIVDYLGIATPSAVAPLKAGDPIRTYEAERPQVVIDTSNFRYFTDPLEFDWFLKAYAKAETLIVPGDPNRSRFTVYRLRDAAAIPAPLAPVAVTVTAMVQGADLAVRFMPIRETRTVQLRVRVPRSCSRVVVSLSGGGSVRRTVEALDAGRRDVVRFTAVAPQPLQINEPYTLRVGGCRAMRFEPASRLRENGFIVFGKPAAPPPRPVDAFAAFGPSEGG
ncbi:MAG TPA: hypothetical protein VFL13_05090 [Candidatus Baltobacteraceae bacterium]|nr:hypothetical protein [Candidatus Baltobacteraceae bacterium]